jgi:hypothetical protein
MSTTVIVRGPVTEGTATNVAVTVTEVGITGATKVAVAGVVGGVTGVIVPHVLGVQPEPRLQVTAVAVEFATVAVSVTDCVG